MEGTLINGYEAVIGLEVHAELNTQSKIYCGCKNAFGLEVNTQACPICMGMPGTLPTLNRKVVEYAVRMGHALNCHINLVSKQDRKNYFYPDLPKAYQISQSDTPLCEKGYLDVLIEGKEKRIGVTRIHIEEDAGKLLHDDAFAGSLVDMNRCGVPLIEIVSEPDMRSSAEAHAYLETIKSILQYLDISDCKMQEGSIRCDVNVSIHKPGEPFGTRSEMKNVNSFSGAVRGIEYEIKRQIEVLEQGGKVVQETRRWDDLKGESISMRSKEEAQDYRYFPEPDLLNIVLNAEEVERWRGELPELPNAKVGRYIKDYGLSQKESEQLVSSLDKSRLFDSCTELKTGGARGICNWILGDISKYMNETGRSIWDTKLNPQGLAHLVEVIEKGTISTGSGRQIFELLLEKGEESQSSQIDRLIEEMGLSQNSDTGALEDLAREVLSANEKSVNDYKGGKTNALGFLVGQCMKASKGKANPSLMKDIVTKLLES